MCIAETDQAERRRQRGGECSDLIGAEHSKGKWRKIFISEWSENIGVEQIKNISAERKNHSQKSEAYLEERIGVERVVQNNKSEEKQEVYIRECDEVMDVA